MIGGRQPLRGKKPGDRRVRVERPHARYFRYTGKGVMTAKPAATAPTTAVGRVSGRRPAGAHRAAPRHATRSPRSGCPRRRRWPSSARTPSAPAPMRPRRSWSSSSRRAPCAFTISLEIAIAIAILLAVVSTSYRQIGHAYPNGGGAYAVGRANLGKLAALVAAGALLVDYILTVAVSISSAVEQITSAVPVAAALGAWLMGVAVHPAHDAGQPPGHPRVGQHLRHPDVPVRGQRPDHDRPRRLPGGRRWAQAARPPTPCRARPARSSR